MLKINSKRMKAFSKTSGVLEEFKKNKDTVFYEQKEERNLNDFESLYNAGVYFCEMDENQKSSFFYEKALRIYPNHLNTYNTKFYYPCYSDR